jgi:hypothetical protein
MTLLCFVVMLQVDFISKVFFRGDRKTSRYLRCMGIQVMILLNFSDMRSYMCWLALCLDYPARIVNYPS